MIKLPDCPDYLIRRVTVMAIHAANGRIQGWSILAREYRPAAIHSSEVGFDRDHARALTKAHRYARGWNTNRMVG